MLGWDGWWGFRVADEVGTIDCDDQKRWPIGRGGKCRERKEQAGLEKLTFAGQGPGPLELCWGEGTTLTLLASLPEASEVTLVFVCLGEVGISATGVQKSGKVAPGARRDP